MPSYQQRKGVKKDAQAASAAPTGAADQLGNSEMLLMMAEAQKTKGQAHGKQASESELGAVEGELDYWELYSELQEQCPALTPDQAATLRDEKELPEALEADWEAYGGDSAAFHGGFGGMLAKESTDGLYNECFYDDEGNLLRQDDKDNPYAAVGGSPDTHKVNPNEMELTPESMEDVINHTLNMSMPP